MDHVAVDLGHLRKAVWEKLRWFRYLFSDMMTSNNDHWRAEGPKVNKHKRRLAKRIIHSGKRKVYLRRLISYAGDMDKYLFRRSHRGFLLYTPR